MKLKRTLSILIIIVVIIHLSSNIILATDINNNDIQFSIDKPVISNQENKLTPQKINLDDLKSNKSIDEINKQVILPDSKQNRKILKSSSQSADEYQGQLEENKNDVSNTFVSRDNKHYTYMLNKDILPNISIYRYCFETNENIVIYKNEDLNLYSYYAIIHNNVYIKNNIIYFAAFSKTDDSHLQILGYNTENETITYSNSFEISKDNYAESFCVDNYENVYVVINGQAENSLRINTYNKDGVLISVVNQDLFSSYYSIKITNSNDNMIWIKAFTLKNNYLYPVDIAMRTNKGIFVNNTPIELYSIGMDIEFLNDEQTVAYDQYGQLIEFSYTNDSVNFSILNYISLKSNEYFFIPYENFIEEPYMYAGGENGIILKYNWNTFKVERALSIGENKSIVGVYKASNKLFIEYADSEYNIYALVLDYEKFNTPKQIIELTEHPNISRTKEDIKTKYNATDIVNKINFYNVYNEEPSTTSPYTAGSLNEQTKTDTLNQINYFRWLAGVEEVTINEDYMEYAQCGSVLLTTSSELMHKPSQPSDMPDEFYEKAVGATNAEIGIPMSANISVYSPMAESIKGYVDDVANIEPDIGHRLSILDNKATTTSFGFAGYNGTVDMFTTTDTITGNKFYSWPSPGLFPVESIDKEAMWSISFNDENMYPTGNIDIVLKANEKAYSSSNNDFEIYYDNYYNTYYYALPSEVKEYLTDGKDSIQNGKKVDVELTGLADLDGNEYTIKSPVEFMSIKDNESLYKKGDVNGNGTIEMTDYSMILKHVKGIKTLTGEQLERADVNGNGSIEMTDYSMVLKHVKGIKLLY